MKFNKVMKIVIALLLVVMCALVVAQTASASIDPMNTNQKLSATYNKLDNSGASEAASNIIGAIINIAQVIGMGVAIIMLIVLAIQYIAASPEGKAEVKKNATVYIVGAIILFAASGILGIIRRFAIQSVGNAGDE
jgi:drug/metabolite transporter (DMT)-like permease